MQIQTASAKELACIIKGLDALAFMKPEDETLREKLLKQFKNELTQRYGMKVSED